MQTDRLIRLQSPRQCYLRSISAASVKSHYCRHVCILKNFTILLIAEVRLVICRNADVLLDTGRKTSVIDCFHVAVLVVMPVPLHRTVWCASQ
jgi:hypothetical protein